MMRWHFCLRGPAGAASMGTCASWVPGIQHQRLSGIHVRVEAGLQGDGRLAGPSAELRSRSLFAGQGINLVWERGRVDIGWLLLSWRYRLLVVGGLFGLSQIHGEWFLNLWSVLARSLGAVEQVVAACTEGECLSLGDVEGSSQKREDGRAKFSVFPLCVSYRRLELLC